MAVRVLRAIAGGVKRVDIIEATGLASGTVYPAQAARTRRCGRSRTSEGAPRTPAAAAILSSVSGPRH